MDNLNKSYLNFVESPETETTGDCQKVDGRGWEDTKQESTNSASLYVDSISGIQHTTPYHECD